MTEERLALGRWGEEQAVRFLRRKGLKIVARNLRTPVGEIDIIARHKKTLVFVEVKTRRNLAFGAPQEAVGPTKQRQIRRTAQWYLADQGTPTAPARFDVVAVVAGPGEPVIEHIVNAFDLPG